MTLAFSMSVVRSEEHPIILSLDHFFALGSLVHPSRPDLSSSWLVGENGLEQPLFFHDLGFLNACGS